MKFSAFAIAAGIPLVVVAEARAGVKSGHAEVEWVGTAGSVRTGQATTVGIRLVLDEGWHTYWINPGEGGMPLKATWKLPEGWTASALKQPVPKRFKTGDLPGFGYEKEAIFLVDLTPPAGAEGKGGEATLKLSWLTCNDSACVPGNAELTLKLPAAKAAEAGATELAAAEKKIPTALEGATLKVSESGSEVKLTVTVPAGVDLAGAAAYPATPQVVDPAAPLTFKKEGSEWVTSAAKNEYASGPAKELQLVLAGGKLERPVTVHWQAGK